MIRGLLKLIVLVLVLVAVGVFFFGWNLRERQIIDEDTREAVGTAGTQAAEAGREVGTTAAEKGRQVGAEAGERLGEAADVTKRAVADGSLTAKIKAKMALDDQVKALNLDVDTAGGVVTVSGVVRSEQERQKALQLARETAGVRQVVDKLTIR